MELNTSTLPCSRPAYCPWPVAMNRKGKKGRRLRFWPLGGGFRNSPALQTSAPSSTLSPFVAASPPWPLLASTSRPAHASSHRRRSLGPSEEERWQPPDFGLVGDGSPGSRIRALPPEPANRALYRVVVEKGIISS